MWIYLAVLGLSGACGGDEVVGAGEQGTDSGTAEGSEAGTDSAVEIQGVGVGVAPVPRPVLRVHQFGVGGVAEEMAQPAVLDVADEVVQEAVEVVLVGANLRGERDLEQLVLQLPEGAPGVSDPLLRSHVGGVGSMP